MTTPRKKGLVGRIIELRDPWRFRDNEELYVRGWPQDYPVTVERRVPREQLPHSPAMADAITCKFPTMPHYECRDHLGGTWLLAQMNLSRNTIPMERA
jgi:hypothetical protein